MKILSIGNSFSYDAHKWLHILSKFNGFEIETANLFIGGCSLETHWKNVKENNAHYDFQLNGNSGERKISIEEALNTDEWDIVTLQQASYHSGMFETYEPYLSSLANMIRELQPNAKVYFHQTWAYETDAKREGFAIYNNDQAEMYRRIKVASEIASKTIDAKIIPVGEVIQALRETVPEFYYKNGGLSLCSDGCHLSVNYGRYAASATWFHTITGEEIKITDFEDLNPLLLKKINDIINRF